MNLSEWTMLLALSVLWGGAFFFNGVAVKELPTLTIVAARLGFGAIGLLAMLKVLGIPLPRTTGLWIAFFVMGALNNVLPFSLIVWGQAHIASGAASILNATTPFFTVVAAHWLTDDEALTPAKALGVVVGFFGVFVLIGGEALSGMGYAVYGQLACVAAGLSYAFAAIFGRRFRRLGVDPIATAAGQVAASSLIMLPLAALIETPWTLPSPSAAVFASLVAIGLLSTALGYVLYFRILATAGAGNLSLVTLLIPASAILLGWLVLGEALGPQHFGGMALIATGLVVIDGRLWRVLRYGKAPGGRTPDAL